MLNKLKNRMRIKWNKKKKNSKSKEIGFKMNNQIE